jgi:S-adenosyl-L-methionine hydrolase (adenosine-forming)
MGFDWISFTTDYGIGDGFVAACEGVIARIAPGPRVLHVSHTVPAQDVRRGGAILAQTVPYLPPAVHLAVVDPGVGGPRKPIALRGGDGRLYVGPDNGLLLIAAEHLGGVDEAVELAEPAYRLEPVASTFHGRDVFAPAAAHLASGVELANLGPQVPSPELVRLELPAPEFGTRRIRATVLDVDRFGNIQLNLTSSDLERVGIEPGSLLEVGVGSERYYAVAARTFAEVRTGDILLYEDSYGRISIAINQGNAAEMFGAGVGGELELTAVHP